MSRSLLCSFSLLSLGSLVLGALGCGGEKVDPRFPPRPEGCAVEVFHDQAPTMATDNIGTVNANCTDLTSDQDCLRTLKDQVCKIGGDVVWGVEPTPTIKNGRKLLNGRAAKSRSAAPAASSAPGS